MYRLARSAPGRFKPTFACELGELRPEASTSQATPQPPRRAFIPRRYGLAHPTEPARQALDVAAQAAESLPRGERIAAIYARERLRHERLSGVEGTRVFIGGAGPRAFPERRRRQPAARSRRTSRRRRGRAPARSWRCATLGAQLEAITPADEPRPGAERVQPRGAVDARERAAPGSFGQPLLAAPDVALGEVGQRERGGREQREPPERDGERGLARRRRPWREPARRTAETWRIDAPASARNASAGPLSAGISQNQSTEPCTSQTTSGSSAIAATRARRRPARARRPPSAAISAATRKPANSRKPASPGVREQAQLEAVRPARLLVAAALAQVVRAPVVLAEAAERMVRERLQRDTPEVRPVAADGGEAASAPGVVAW